MMIADAQVHIWADHAQERPWPAEGFARTHRPIPLGAPELLTEMDKAGVNRAVLVPPSFEGDYNDVCLAAAGAHPDRFAVMGRVTLANPSTAALLPTWTQQPGMLGIRLTFLADDQRSWLADGTIDWFWEAAEKAAIPIMCLPTRMIPAIDRVAHKFPDLKLVIDHLAIPTGLKDAAAFAGIKDLVTLARRPNVAVKASCLPSYTTEPYPYAGISGHIQQVFDAFGPRRMFWGSDLTRLPCSYRQCVTHFTEELPFLSGADRELVMGRALCEWLGWDV